jgi:uncharacterized protein YdeI (YjbR/CyaY-like superfamily)
VPKWYRRVGKGRLDVQSGAAWPSLRSSARSVARAAIYGQDSYGKLTQISFVEVSDMARAGQRSDYPIVLFETVPDWERWLDEHHASAPGVWVRFAKKKAEFSSISYAEALDLALCYGWIDSQVKTFDEASYIQKFTPRGRRSVWSKVNRAKVEALFEAGRMRSAGIAAVELAKQDGRWDAAYDSQRNIEVPEDFARALEGNPSAHEFFATLTGANRYSVLWRIQTATKPETRARRIAELVAMLERRETYH